ncbi:family 43 glycosylhydrolase [Flavobacterium sp. MC2016-06]|jgi:xylan 1,4-beta-xylosidase|uniref:family 43 glycosylhydrolase n=1 Tax=Flavobacterium sp. MC2016-06 TaxID=2676308 RepID=UPI0012BAACA4|nr:family 43 glycosylhydrolase [Flavobacterium sp. MC2016-06]MBU3858873.1 family 43 glycosylhydrolase [Flavobacterium sp. MC2016-06]
MQKIFFLFFSLLMLSRLSAQNQPETMTGKLTYQNPIFGGDYPDPSLLRDGKDYYIVHSSFDYYPGLTIWHSQDLINWTPIVSALQKYVGDVWAPDLVKYNNKFYIYFPANKTNYVVSADKIEGPWSEPVDLKIGNIDPGHVTDNNSNRYLYFSNGDYIGLTKDGLSTTGEVKHAYDGWVIPRNWSIECFCMEGPKLFKRGNYYYLTVAEGGTAGPATSHMVISARSKTPFGPWENSPYNPVVRTQNSDEKWWSKGHSTVFEDANGKWWMVLHAYEKGFYNLGRQTLLEPVEWTKDGWYKIPDNIKTEEPITKPIGEAVAHFSQSDDFSGMVLKPQWKFFNGVDAARFKVTNKSLIINGKGKGLGDSSPLVCVPSGHSYMADVEMDIEGEAIGGLVLFYNNSYYSGILADKENILANLRGWQFVTEKKAHNRHLYLRLKNINNNLDMFYSLDGIEWLKIENSAEVSSYNHNALSGFLGLRIALCSIGDGRVTFKNFNYTAL